MQEISAMTVSRHIRDLTLTKKLDYWIPHELNEKNLMDRISACDTHSKRNESNPFLKRLVTDDKK